MASRDFIDEDLSYLLLNRILDSEYKDTEALDNLRFITKFNNEFHKNIIKKGDETALHKTDELRRDCYSRENARNRNYNLEDYDSEEFIPSIPANIFDFEAVRVALLQAPPDEDLGFGTIQLPLFQSSKKKKKGKPKKARGRPRRRLKKHRVKYEQLSLI